MAVRLHVDRIELPGHGAIALDGSGSSGAGRFEAGATAHPGWGSGSRSGVGDATRWDWWVGTGEGGPLRAVRLVFTIADVVGRLRMLRHGYQSWSPNDVAEFGVDRDRSLLDGSVEFIRALNQADQRIVDAPDELRSEWFTLLVDDTGEPWFIGFDGGELHDGTLRLRRGPTGIELHCEAFLGDLVLAPGEHRALHELVVASSAEADALLGAWASRVGDRGRARLGSDLQIGWCSWYHYFHDVTERDIESNLRLADDWPFDVFQVDDGYQSAIGDWLTTNERFPGGVEAMATAIAARGRRPGLWLAPFLVAPDSAIARAHPEWLARGYDGEPLLNMFNAPWGGGRDGFMYGLDPTVPEVRAHLSELAATLVGMGYQYLKLDFTFSPSFDGVWADRSCTPAQRVRAGFDAIRDGAGDDVFLLGCGAPLANVVGVVDGNRIGADVAPSWLPESSPSLLTGYTATLPATRHAWVDTAVRAFMHRRLWSNDPDCVMLRSERTALTPEAARTWARAVGISGGMVLVSDDLSLLGADARSLLDDTIALARIADDAARAGAVAHSPDLLAGTEPTRLHSPAGRVRVDLADGSSQDDH